MTDKQIITKSQMIMRIAELSANLIAKEQECERLRYEIGSLENDRDILQEQLDQLKSENKHLNDLLNQALKELEKTREILIVIKEIAKNGCYDDCGMPLDELSIILQKISEVEDD